MTTDYQAAALEALNSNQASTTEVTQQQQQEEEAPIAGTQEPSQSQQVKVPTTVAEKQQLDQDALPVNAPVAIKKAFEKLAARNAEIRAREERIKSTEAIVSKLPENSLQALLRATSAGDAVSALTALGFTAADYMQGIQSLKEQPKPQEQRTVDPVVEGLQKQVAELRAQLEGDAVQRGRANTIARLKEIATTRGSFEYVTELEDSYKQALSIVEDHVAKNGAPEPDEIPGILEAALAAVDEQLRAEAMKWEGLLTKKRKAVSPQESATTEKSQPKSIGQKTISNNLTSGSVAPAAQPKTEQEYVAAAMEVLARGAR